MGLGKREAVHSHTNQTGRHACSLEREHGVARLLKGMGTTPITTCDLNVVADDGMDYSSKL